MTITTIFMLAGAVAAVLLIAGAWRSHLANKQRQEIENSHDYSHLNTLPPPEEVAQDPGVTRTMHHMQANNSRPKTTAW